LCAPATVVIAAEPTRSRLTRKIHEELAGADQTVEIV
jgi:hypothetical protein